MINNKIFQNNEGRTPVDIAFDLRTPAMKNEILKILVRLKIQMNRNLD